MSWGYGETMKLVFAGTPEFAVPTLRKLVSAGHELALVITQPDRPAGRGREMHPPAVKQLALELRLSVFQPESINDPESAALIRCIAPDAMVVQAFGQKLSGELLSLPRLGCLNVHASLLPAYRGAAPINHAILRGEERTGITVMRMSERIDAGEILAQEAIAIHPNWTAGDLSDALAPVGAELIVRTLAEVEAGGAQAIAQDRSKVSKAPKLDKSDGLVPWQKSAREVHNHIRGMTPWPGAFSFFAPAGSGHLLRVSLVRAVSVQDSPAPQSPGAVMKVGHEGITVACGSGAVVIERVKPAGSREMSGDEFARGHGVKAGAAFTSVSDRG